jgi:hypothetical protein
VKIVVSAGAGVVGVLMVEREHWRDSRVATEAGPAMTAHAIFLIYGMLSHHVSAIDLCFFGRLLRLELDVHAWRRRSHSI